MSERIPLVGQFVVYHDPVGKAHDALVTEAWSATTVNLVYVSSDKEKHDSYGRQIERSTSCMHKEQMKVHGNYWRFNDEEPNPYTPPLNT